MHRCGTAGLGALLLEMHMDLLSSLSVKGRVSVVRIRSRDDKINVSFYYAYCHGKVVHF